MSQDAYRCRLCGATTFSAFSVREMLHGTRETFFYFECPSCGCVQRTEFTQDFGELYPSDYYSFQPGEASLRTRVRTAVFRILIPATRRCVPLRESLRARFQSFGLLVSYDEAVQGDRNASVLDVGAGTGEILRSLLALGYRNVSGIDRYIKQDVAYGGRILVSKRDLIDIEDTYKVISFNHSLEHMPDQRAVLLGARERLTPDGRLIIRIPVMGGAAWQDYREHWVGLDAPRHLYLHSTKSLQSIAEQTGFSVRRLMYDATGYHFWGSELYRRDIPLNGPHSLAGSVEKAYFSARQLAEFDYRARAANRAGRGDSITAILMRA